MKYPQLLVIGMFFVAVAASAAYGETIYDIQYTTDPSGDSPYNGQAVTTAGVVTAVFYNGYVIAEGAGPWQAIYTQSQYHGPEIGDEIQISGTVLEISGMTLIYEVTSYHLISTGNTISPLLVSAIDANQEQYESVLLTIADLTVTSLESYGEWIANDVSGDIRCDDLNDYMYFPQIGDGLTSITGILFYRYGAYALEPRNTSDIAGDVIPHYAIGGDIVTMNPALDILEDAYIEILGDRIMGITTSPPRDLLIVETGGLIFPGLIDGHNHAAYNILDHIPFGQTFEERYEWQATQMYSDFNDQLSGIVDYGGYYAQAGNIFKVAEVRALCAGTTTMQGRNCNSDSYNFFAKQGMIVNNAERFPSRIYSKTFPMNENISYWQDMKEEYWDRFVIHLSEGINDAAMQEFYTWQAWGMLDWRTTILHGIPYGPTEWQLMADADANIVWSPMSDVVLYGVSPDIPGALAAGVNVAIAPDWTESGTRDMLEEINYGNELNDNLWGGVIEPVDFALFATRNAALAMGAEDRIGQVVTGFQADLMVIPGSPTNPYEALIDAEASDVQLTVVSGRPMYGDPELMDQFLFLDDLEDISVCETPKTLATQITAYSIDESDRPLATVLSQLQYAYDNTDPKVCDFLGPFECRVSDVAEVSEAVGRNLCVGPNPMHTKATFSFSTPQSGPVCLKIYNVNGGVVRTLVNRSLASGEHNLVWDGCDANGLSVACGVYLVQLEAGTQIQTGKVLMIR